ncbi:MAG: hypothetical protein JWP89_3740 [Schlesneria sp.]|nr:hypothetical protein [Schlesneria sp.]
MTTTSGQSNLSARPMSRVEWAIARYNWYRACGLLDDLPQQTTEVANDQRSPDPPPPMQHLKWYPLSKPDDDIAGTYQQPVAATQRHRYSQRVDNAHPQTFPTRGYAEKALHDDSSKWSRVDWAIARYNWYRACGLLEDLAPPTAETTRYQKSSDPPTPKPHLKWYPLSKSDDDAATAYQRSVIESPPEPQRRYCQRVEHARAWAMLARYQAEKEAGSGNNFDPSKHPRADAGQPNGGQFIDSNTRVFRTGEGKHFVVSSDDKWRHKPSAGLHIPGLSHGQAENFLDLVEQGSALREEMSENDQKIAEAEDAIRRHGWNPFGSKAHLQSLKAQLAELERDGVALQREWAKLEAEYKQAGFHEHEVTGYRSGANAEYQQDSTGGKGFKNAVRAYRKSQEEDLRGGQGVEPTYDEMSIISAPADAAFRLGAAVLRGGYHVVKQGGRYVLQRHAARQAAKTLGRKVVKSKASLASRVVGKAADREFREQMFDKMRQLGATIDKSKAAQKELAEQSAEAMVKVTEDAAGNRTLTAMFGPAPTRSALLEEHIHLIQLKKGGRYDQFVRQYGEEQALIRIEIEAKEEIVRTARQWKIPYDEIDRLRQQIADENRKLATLNMKE